MATGSDPDGAPFEEAVDRVSGRPDLTAWRRAARRHQHQWRLREGSPVGGARRPVGSQVEDDFARRSGCNFLTPAARAAVEHRIAHPERWQTLDTRRLWGNLLSSMPMCFNLFGPLWADPTVAAAVSRAWFPQLFAGHDRVEVRFEWSPGRGDPAWLGDRTSFDAVLVAGGAEALVGIETKYHEVPEKPTTSRQAAARYVELSERFGLFTDPAAVERVAPTPLEQLWRDHLLAIACAMHPAGPAAITYVLVAPAGNVAWAEVAAEYAALLSPAGRACFEFRTLESLLDDAGAALPGADLFRARYLEVEP